MANYVLSHIRFVVYKLSEQVQTGSNGFSEIPFYVHAGCPSQNE